MTKTLLDFKPSFDPVLRTLDFRLFPDFTVSKLFAVINVTQNTPIYIPGASGYGISSINGQIITLSYDTSLHSASDILNVYYSEKENISLSDDDTLKSILTELRVHSIILIEHLHRPSLSMDDLIKIRNDINNLSITDIINE
jgi:hypothetical protein